MKVTPYIKRDESHAYVISLFKLCLTRFKSFWMTPCKYWSCLPSPGMVSPSCPNSDCFLMAQNCLFPVVQENCESPSWSCGWGLMEQPNSFPKISSHLFSPTGIYKVLQTKESDLSMSITPIVPKPLERLRWALPGSKQATESPLARPQIL